MLHFPLCFQIILLDLTINVSPLYRDSVVCAILEEVGVGTPSQRLAFQEGLREVGHLTGC